MQLSPEEIKTTRARCRNDFQFYAEHFLKIRPKSGALVPFKLNRAQRYAHELIEKQLKDTGKVRVLIPKARQEGISTYVGARFYHKVTHGLGLKAYILSHHKDTTEELFEMVDTFQSSIPELFAAKVSTNNTKELVFPDLDKSGYRVGTAGGAGTMGRGMTIQLLHGSEVAKWKNEHEIISGIMEAVPECDGSEIILESTGNGIGNMFHRMCMESLEGKNDYQVIFIPWFWMEEYYDRDYQGIVLTQEEQEYKTRYGLNDGQMKWRRKKISVLGESRFKQEYPANVAECFQTPNDDPLIDPDIIMRARKTHIQTHDHNAALVIGVDPARHGGDRTALIWRQGRVMLKKNVFTNEDLMLVINKIIKAIRDDAPDKVFLDIGGLGWGIYDVLRERGHGNVVTAVNFGERALDSDKYFNKRAEMWGLMRDWITQEPCDLKDDDELMMDLTAPSYSYDSNSRLKLETKEAMKKRGMKSPDLGDALALTFAHPVSKLAISNMRNNNIDREGGMYV